MNSIRKKLNNNSGSSIMLALGLLLICTMISSVVVTMAATGSSRHTQERVEQQREYLSISSAAETVMEEITKLKKYKGEEIEIDFACNDYCNNETRTTMWYKFNGDTESREYEGWAISAADTSLWGHAEVNNVLIPLNVTPCQDVQRYREQSTSPEGALSKVVCRGMDKLYKNNLDGNETSYSEPVTIELPDSDGKIKPVKCNFVMDKDYNITMKLTMDGSNYAITISAKATKEETESTTTDDAECNHSAYYNYFEDGSFKSANDGNVHFAGIKDIKTTTVTWGEPKLTREG